METKSTELVKIVSESGLEKVKQNQIVEALSVFFDKAAEWDGIIKTIVITNPEETGKMKMAKEGRLTLKNLRLDAIKIVTAKRDAVRYAMANYVLEDKLLLRAGQMMEATFKNLETQLEEKEKFAERWEADKREKLKADRTALLLPLGFQPDGGSMDLGRMDDESFNALKLGLETEKAKKEEAERKAEEARIAYEKEQERIRLENERLKKEAIAKEKQMARDRAEAEAKQKAIEESARKARAEAEAREKKLRADQEAKLEKERKERERLQAEIKARAEAEAREKKRIEEAERVALKAPDKIKLLDFAEKIGSLESPILQSDEAKHIITDALVLLSKTVQFIKNRAEKL